MKLGVLDYGAGNLRSVLNAFSAIDHPAKLVAGPADFEGIDTLVFPGQGAFGDSVRILKQNDLWSPLKDWLANENLTSASASATSYSLRPARNRPALKALVWFQVACASSLPTTG
jgi:hypothetical protein